MNDDASRPPGDLKRRIAEALEAGPDPGCAMSVQELAQEVSVYYRELEFQNDELRRIRAELERSQEQYKELYENAPVGFVSYYPDLRVHSANRTFLSCVSGDPWGVQKLDALLTPDSQDDFYFHVKELLRTREAQVCRLRFSGPEGAIPVRMESNLLLGGEEPIIRSAVSNISAEAELQARLSDAVTTAQENERKLRLLFDFIPMGLTIADGGGKITGANRAASRILGLDQESHLRRSIDGTEWKLIRRDGREMPSDEYASVRALRERRLVENVEMGLVKGDSAPTWILVNAVPTDIPGFELVISYLDTTLLVSKEEELKQSEQKLRLFLDNIPQPVVITDPDGHILDVNAALCRFYGYSREESLGKTPRILNPGRDTYRELGYSDGEYRELFGNLWSSVRDPERGSWEGVLVNRKKDGSLIWVKLLIKAIHDPLGKPVYFIALPIDISILGLFLELEKVFEAVYRELRD